MSVNELTAHAKVAAGCAGIARPRFPSLFLLMKNSGFMKNSRAIVALDVETVAQARALVSALGDAAVFYKVGLELYTSAGMDFVRELKSQGRQVFLDLKMYDIGETVKRAVAQVAEVQVDFLTVHAMRPVMAAAVEGRAGSGLKLLGVTVLTSFDEADLKQAGYALSLRELVELRVRHAVETGMDGVVCSPLEVERVRALAPKAILVTPGVRSAGAAVGDQKRVATPAQAIASGADYVVVGRQVTRAADPRAEMLRIAEEIGNAV
jgi:orotidine-5'-phosphate decarboxylase